MKSNNDIDDLVLNNMKTKSGKTDKLTNIRLSGILLRSFNAGELKMVPHGEKSQFWLASEHINRSCQRLRKRGLIQFIPKEGWILIN